MVPQFVCELVANEILNERKDINSPDFPVWLQNKWVQIVQNPGPDQAAPNRHDFIHSLSASTRMMLTVPVPAEATRALFTLDRAVYSAILVQRDLHSLNIRQVRVEVNRILETMRVKSQLSWYEQKLDNSLNQTKNKIEALSMNGYYNHIDWEYASKSCQKVFNFLRRQYNTNWFILNNTQLIDWDPAVREQNGGRNAENGKPDTGNSAGKSSNPAVSSPAEEKSAGTGSQSSAEKPETQSEEIRSGEPEAGSQTAEKAETAPEENRDSRDNAVTAKEEPAEAQNPEERKLSNRGSSNPEREVNRATVDNPQAFQGGRRGSRNRNGADGYQDAESAEKRIMNRIRVIMIVDEIERTRTGRVDRTHWHDLFADTGKKLFPDVSVREIRALSDHLDHPEVVMLLSGFEGIQDTSNIVNCIISRIILVTLALQPEDNPDRKEVIEQAREFLEDIKLDEDDAKINRQMFYAIRSFSYCDQFLPSVVQYLRSVQKRLSDSLNDLAAKNEKRRNEDQTEMEQMVNTIRQEIQEQYDRDLEEYPRRILDSLTDSLHGNPLGMMYETMADDTSDAGQLRESIRAFFRELAFLGVRPVGNAAPGTEVIPGKDCVYLDTRGEALQEGKKYQARHVGWSIQDEIVINPIALPREEDN